MTTINVPDQHDPATFDYSTLPPWTQPYEGGDPKQSLRDVRSIIENAIVNHPRSLQKRIGPSEIGNPCDHCVAAKLAGWQETERGIPWLTTIGTAVHAWCEDVVNLHESNRNALHTTGRRWLSEQKVMVGHIGGAEVWGSTDLVDVVTGVVIDFKVVGPTTLRSAKAGPEAKYRVQADLYAKGWNDAGHRIDHVAIAYLPRNAQSLDDAIWWTAPHDRGRAERALERANQLHTNLAALASISETARDAWITSLPRAPRCWDCARYPDGLGMTAPGHRDPVDSLAGLIPAA